LGLGSRASFELDTFNGPCTEWLEMIEWGKNEKNCEPLQHRLLALQIFWRTKMKEVDDATSSKILTSTEENTFDMSDLSHYRKQHITGSLYVKSYVSSALLQQEKRSAESIDAEGLIFG
ncbi:hypothetical protein ACJX0J_012464, partial [Zea mays]